MAEAESYPPISDYALIGDLHSCALVSKAGSIDWCCLPRFDSPSVFGRVLDWARGGYFQVAAEGTRAVRRRYLPDTKILETTIETESGVATLTDFMPTHNHADPETPFEFGARQYIARILHCVEGQVRFSLICRPRFDYGSIAPHTLLQGDHCGIAHGG
ncbi:MAG: trehalase-like domain-containing protein, partial [Dehalococcoidia bacterium]